MRAFSRTLVALLALALCVAAEAFYLPGVAPQDYARDDIVYMKVNKLSSTRTQLPFEYYSLPYCRPHKVAHSVENLGEVLRGDRIENSLYSLEMRFDQQCKLVCKIDSLTASQAGDFAAKIEDEYRVMMILDNLPVAMVRMLENEEGEQLKTYERGFPVGFKAKMDADGAWVPPDVAGGDAKAFINNHVRFTVLYHKDEDTDSARIVGFEAEPFSVKHTYEKPWNPEKPILETCNAHRMTYVSYDQPPQEVREGEEVIFTYDVLFKPSDIRWASRWDTYLLMTDAQIHWFSIVNSMMIVLFLSGMVALIMLRTLRRDITKYNELETAEEAAEESGWKLVHGDVFRAPKDFDLLSVLVGTGAQVACMFAVTLVFALLGFLSPANRGALMTAMVSLFIAAGTRRRVRLRDVVPNFQRHELGETRVRHRNVVPRVNFRDFLRAEHADLARKKLGRGAVRNLLPPRVPVVRGLRAFSVRRRVPRAPLAYRGRSEPDAHEQDPEASS